MKMANKWLVLLMISLLTISNAFVLKAEELTDGLIGSQDIIEQLSSSLEVEEGDIDFEEEEPLLFNEANDETYLDYVKSDSGKCGGRLTWTLKDGVLTISGTGDMWDFNLSPSQEDSPPWFGHFYDIREVRIEPGVLSIGRNAFYDLLSLEKITIPSTVTSIGSGGFVDCRSLKEITIPSSVESIGRGAFVYCKALSKIILPEKLKKISAGLFEDCSGLKEITIPNGVTNIEVGAFTNCNNLKDINIPDSVTTIGGAAFFGCTSLEKVVLPTRLTTIEPETFQKCNSLIRIEIPSIVKSIGYRAFSGCINMEEVTFLGEVESIGEDAFNNCKSLTKVSIPEGVISIGQTAFEKCSSITEVILPSTLTKLGWGVFNDCSHLKSIYFSGNAPGFDQICFGGVTASAYYPRSNATWTETTRQNYGGEITWISWDPSTVIDTPEPTPVDTVKPSLSASYNSSRGGDIRWKLLEGVTGYVIYRNRQADGLKKVAIINDPNIIQYIDSDIKDNCWGRVYAYYIRPLYGMSEGPKSDTLTLQRLAPMKVTSAINESFGSVDLTWACTVNENKALGYEVQYAESKEDLFGQKGTFKKISVNGRNKLSKTITDLTAGNTYYFRIRCYVNYTHSVTGKQTKTWSQYSDVVKVLIEQ